MELQKDSVSIKDTEVKEEKSSLLLNDQNAIPFFFEYQKENLEDKVRVSTRFGDIDIQLYQNTPYHRANFIYLTKKEYFNGSTFHRVVPGFIIQGGNSDRRETVEKRRKIGKYLLPPDTRKGNQHHRGVISMPSSEIENPHKLASPYEFFIVQKSPGAYHLDGSYTAFGKVIKGMDVVDQINKQKVNDYYDLLLAEETQRYLPRIIAIKEIISKPNLYGFHFDKEDLYELTATKTVTVDTVITNIADFAKKMNTNYKELKIHNPWLRENRLNNKSKKVYHLKIEK